MKHKNILSLALFTFLLAEVATAQPDIIDLGIFNNPANSNRLEVRLRPTQAVINGTYSGGVFTVRYPSSYNVELTVPTLPFGVQPYNYAMAAQGTFGGFKYYAFSFGGGFTGQNWAANQEVVIARIDHTNDGVGIGTFELTNDANAMAIGGDFYQEVLSTQWPFGANGQQNDFYHPSASAPLPVELLSFNANALPNGSTALDWESASEIDLDNYTIEHSTDGSHFDVLGKENARGGVNKPAQYVYNHASPQAGINYYRLRMVDRNGGYDFSPIRSVTFAMEDSDFSLLPNPTSGPLDLISRHLDKFTEGLSYELTDNTGRLIRTDKITDEKTRFDLSNEPAGAYYLKIASERQQIREFRVVVTPKD